MTTDYKSTQREQEKALLIGVINQSQNQLQVNEYLDELEFLAYTVNVKTVGRVTQRLESQNARTFIGEGKMAEVKKLVDEKGIDLIIFDDELSPVQLRNIDKVLSGAEGKPGCRVLDRNNLILDIFAARARTATAKAQVALAQYQYLLPRLTRMWTHLERQKGGIGLRGPGETELETDRRVIREKIKRLKDTLQTIDKQKATQRKHRSQMIRVSLAGYTNAGKSTLMNLLSNAEVFAENKLFATLDTTVRKMTIGNLPFLLSDTVGFIRKLPHQLIESFKSTLDEVRQADLLIHVVDISHPSFEAQIAVANNTLKEIQAHEIPTILVFNKVDLYKDAAIGVKNLEYNNDKEEKVTLANLKKTWMARLPDKSLGNLRACLFISALKKHGIDELKKVLYDTIKPLHTKRYPYNSLLY